MTPASAPSSPASTRACSRLVTASVDVPTIVCGGCAKKIEKAVYALEGVKSVDVDVDRKVAVVKFVPAQTNLETIEITITDAGYDANNRKRDPAAYDELDACCKKDG